MNSTTKRIIASLTAAAAMGSCSISPLAVAGIVPELSALTATAAEDLTYGDFSYAIKKVDESDEITITKYNGTDTEVTIPAEIDKIPVTEIGERVFENKKDITKVVLPDSLKSIRQYAFRGCNGLTDINFPEGLEDICFAAFDNASLTEVSLPKSLTFCDNGLRIGTLKKVTFADGTEKIPDKCLESASTLEEVVVPESVKTIGQYAFRGCNSLTDFKFHEGLEDICFAAFDGTSLTEVSLPKSLTFCDNGLRIGTLKKVTFADGTEKIPDKCLESASAVEEIVVPESVKTIGQYAFRGCKSLTDFKFHEGLEDICFAAFDGTSLTEVNLPKSLTFCDCGLRIGTLKKVTFADGTETIPDKCLESASAVEEIVVPESVKTIGQYAFRGCKSLTDFKFHEGLETIGFAAFDNTSLVDITLPSTLKNCSEGIRNTTLRKVTFTDGIETIPNKCFDGVTGLSEVVLPASVKTIDSYAFRNTTALRSITLPENLETISSDAFRGSGIRSLVIPDSVTSIGSNAFQNCKHLKEAVVGSGVTKLPSYLFSDCTQLEKVTLPDTLESIGSCAFYNCRKLSGVELDALSYKIDDTAFRKCYSLKDTRFVYLSRPESEIKASVTKAAVGNKVDFTVDFDGLDQYTENSKKFTVCLTVPKELTIDPESVKAVSGTLIAENPISSNYKEIAFETESGKLTFSAIASEAGDFDIDADLRFTYKNHNDCYAPIGSVSLSVKELTLSAPEVMNELKTEFGGTGPKGEKVEVYMNDKLLASPVCNEVNGKFTLPIELPKGTKDGDTFTVYAKYGDVSTDPQVITYSPEKSAISDVKIRVNNTGDVDITNVFTSCYSPVMTLLPEHRMKFTVNITNSALLSKVYVTSTKDGTMKRMEAQYDSKNDVWVAEGNFGNNSYVPGYLNFVLVTKDDAKAGKETDFTEGYFSRDGYIRFIVDPSGVVYEGAPSNPVAGAEMTLYTVDENDKLIKWDPTDYDQINPLLTNEEGEYSWDVPEGEWKVMCCAEGYDPAESEWFEVPPAKIDINFALVNRDPGEITDITYDENVITLKFSKYMNPESVNDSTVSVEGLGEYTVDPDYHVSNEEYTDTFKINGDYENAVDVTVKVGKGCLTYAGAENTREKEETFRINDPVTTTEAVEEPAVNTTTTAAPETKPAATTSTKPAETKPVTTTAAKTTETKPAEIETIPVATKPATTTATKAAETKPTATTATKAAETKPAATTATKAAETKPAATTATKAVETEPATTTADETQVPVETTPAGKLGDINGDGMIDSNDASVVLEDYAKASTGGESEIDKTVGDINSDGIVDSNDASIILAYYAAVSTGKDIKLEDFLTEE